jgi:hypothetical protein
MFKLLQSPRLQSPSTAAINSGEIVGWTVSLVKVHYGPLLSSPVSIALPPQVRVSYIEIYNEKLYDLLSADPTKHLNVNFNAETEGGDSTMLLLASLHLATEMGAFTSPLPHFCRD